MIVTALLLLANIEITSVTPSKDVLMTDEPFHVAVHVKNGATETKDVKVKLGVNTLSFMNELVAPKGWTCERGARFGYAVSCTTPSLAANAEGDFTLTMAAPQHSAMPYRVGARVESGDASDVKEKVLSIVSSKTHAELALTTSVAAKQVKVEIKNAGPDDARDVMVVVESSGLAFTASGDGWKCKDAICTRALLRAGTSASFKVVTAAPPDGKQATVSARVRADRIREDVIKDNGAKITVP